MHSFCLTSLFVTQASRMMGIICKYCLLYKFHRSSHDQQKRQQQKARLSHGLKCVHESGKRGEFLKLKRCLPLSLALVSWRRVPVNSTFRCWLLQQLSQKSSVTQNDLTCHTLSAFQSRLLFASRCTSEKGNKEHELQQTRSLDQRTCVLW
jgi:hypothetical protein